MDRFTDWFNQTVPGSDASLPAAGIAHLYLLKWLAR
jgi:hypothetical protein